MKRILLVEDNEMIRENTTEILELTGYSVLIAKNGQEGLDMARLEIPDLIICDIMMPELNGYNMLKLLRKESPLADIPFIFFTASAEKSEIQKGIEMGANDYITKPFDPDDLLLVIARYL